VSRCGGGGEYGVDVGWGREVEGKGGTFFSIGLNELCGLRHGIFMQSEYCLILSCYKYCTPN
jgi:hypothetical protein